MNRTRALGLVLAASLAAAGWGAFAWRARAAPALDCPPAEIHLDEHGVARCGAALALPVGQALTVGQKVDLNRASAEELALIPGVPLEVARALVAERARLGGFAAWSEIDAVDGVGPARLEALQSHCVFGAVDGGV